MFALVIWATWPFLSEQTSSPAAYSIASVDYAPTPLQQVGRAKAGLLCLPNGRLRWRDVAQCWNAFNFFAVINTQKYLWIVPAGKGAATVVAQLLIGIRCP